MLTQKEIDIKKDELSSAKNNLRSVEEEVEYWEGAINTLEKELGECLE